MLSYWEKNLFAHTYDCAIIGGGLVGTHTAINILKTRPKAKVLIIEKENLGAAASTKNAGFACIGSPSELVADINEYGVDTVAQLVTWKWQGLQRTFKMLGKQKIMYKSVKAYDLFAHDAQISYAKSMDNLDTLNTLLKDITNIYPYYQPVAHTPQQLFGFDEYFDNAIQISNEGQLQPAQMLRHLHLKAQNMGAQILVGVGVAPHIQSKTNHQQLELTNKMTINARHAMICVNGFAAHFLGNDATDNAVNAGRGQVHTTNILDKILPFRANFHFDSGYTYFRNIGSHQILIGGGRNNDFKNENTTNYGESDAIQAHLHKITRHILPTHTPSIHTQWSGIMGFTHNGKPIIKTINPNIHCAVGLNGMGVAMGAEVGAQAAQLVGKIW